MPPPSYPQQLDERELALLDRWVREGLDWKEHWAFEAPVEPSLPAEAAEPWCADPLDAFVLQGIRAAGLDPAPPSDRATWLRRVTLALTGLPPTPEELAGFSADADPGAEARVVERLLDSPRRAEHRTREWLDLARYADTNGFQNDFGRDQWPWRDWVLRAFGENLPYDTFVLQQMAGDLLAEADLDAIVATGFHRNHRTVTEAGSIDEEWRVEKVADRAETTATAFLGLTLGCARCHDHKYDPLSREDYYRFYAFFDQIDERGYYEETRGNVPPVVSVPSPAHEAELASLQAKLDGAQREVARLEASAHERYAAWRGADAAAVRSTTVGSPVLQFNGGSAAHGPVVRLDPSEEGHVDLGRSVQFRAERPFTVTLWLRPESHGAVYSRMEDNDRYRGTDLVLLDDMRPAVHLIHEWRANAIKVIGEVPLERGRWQHIAVVYDGSQTAAGVQLFVNLIPQTVTVEVDTLTGTIEAAEPLRIGRRRYAGALTAQLHDFRVDDWALGLDQLRALAADRTLFANALDDPYHLAFFVPFDAEQLHARGTLAGLQREHEASQRRSPTVMVLRERQERRETRILDRGAYDRPVGDPLEPALPKVLGKLAEGAPANRLALARWMIAEDNPLTARVAVNRVWSSFFGHGLVATPEDFGTRGDLPSHPELLDHLAVSFVRSGWDLRALERRIALSATFRQSSSASPELLRRDPANRLLARGPRHRMDAEVVRDQALHVAGLLVEQLGGPSVKPYQPAGLWEELAGGAGEGPYVQGRGPDLYRRSLYTYRKRTVSHPTLATFDAPSFEGCTVARPRTNTPLQVLAVWNDPTYVEAARHLALRIWSEAANDEGRLRAGIARVLCRSANAAELQVLSEALAAHRARFSADAASAAAYLNVGDSAPREEDLIAVGAAEWAALSAVAATLLSLDEAITIR